MKITTLSAAVCITASAAILWQVQPPLPAFGPSQPTTTLGYVDGKQCNHANGCNLRPTFSKCLACCLANCPYPWYDGCVDECIAVYDPKEVYGSLIDATDILSKRKGEGFGDALSMIVAVQSSKDDRLAHVARLLAVESQDYGGLTGILQER